MSEVKQGTELGVRNVHLINGIELIGEVFHVILDKEGVDYFVIERPVVPLVRQNGDQMQVSFAPFRPYVSEDKLLIQSAHVVFMPAVSEKMESGYKQFVSNIFIASPADLKKIITPE